MAAPARLLELVERFDRNLDAYKQGQYKEEQLRREFADPFFKALGWDVDNERGYAEAYKEVVHEDAIRVGGATKAPDYCFRIGGVRKFFVEARKPAIDIKGDVHPAYQLRRYAWSARLPLSILTDFEELSVYDCRTKPEKTDKSGTARTLYVEFQELPARWDEIAGIFSRDAILKGSFDRYVESHKAKRGTAEVDAAFLQMRKQCQGKAIRFIRLEVSLRIGYNTSVENMFARQPQGVWKWADASSSHSAGMGVSTATWVGYYLCSRRPLTTVNRLEAQRRFC